MRKPRIRFRDEATGEIMSIRVVDGVTYLCCLVEGKWLPIRPPSEEDIWGLLSAAVQGRRESF
jgi:hypothetical protein